MIVSWPSLAHPLIPRRFATPPSSLHDNPALFTTLSLLFCGAPPLNQALPPPSHHFESNDLRSSSTTSTTTSTRTGIKTPKNSENQETALFVLGLEFLAGLVGFGFGFDMPLDMPHEDSSA